MKHPFITALLGIMAQSMVTGRSMAWRQGTQPSAKGRHRQDDEPRGYPGAKVARRAYHSQISLRKGRG